MASKKIGLLEKIELIAAFICICTMSLVYSFLGERVSLPIMLVLMIAVTVLLIIFARQHVYWQDKPLLTVFSIYYKSVAYVTIFFTMGHFAATDIITGFAIVTMALYIVLAYFNGKKYDQMLNAYLYLNLITIARLILW